MPTSIRLEPEIEARIDALAARTGRTKAYYLREMIARGLEDVEDYYSAETAMERLRKGEDEIVTLDEVSRNLGLED